jgi:hypothetical protein
MVFIPKCIICIKNPATKTSIKWCDREGRICESCIEKTWTCPDCSRLFYTGENRGFKPRHHLTSKSKNMCHGWKSEKRRAFEKRNGWI